MAKHHTFIKGFAALWLAYLTSMYFEMLDLHDRSLMAQTKKCKTSIERTALVSLLVQDYSYLFLIGQGILIGLIKLDEPNYRFLWLREINGWFGRLTAEQRPNPTYSEMQKGLCTELVYSILTLITEHTSGETKKNYQDYDFNNKSSFTLDNLFVKDPSKFIGDAMDFQSRRGGIHKPKTPRESLKKKTVSDIESKKMLNFKQNINQSEMFSEHHDEDHSNEFMIDKEIKCTEYAPDIFSRLRDLDGITINNLKESLNPELDANVKRI